jgi:hypothetical protein
MKNATGGSSLRCRRLGKEAGKEGGAARVAMCGRERGREEGAGAMALILMAQRRGAGGEGKEGLARACHAAEGEGEEGAAWGRQLDRAVEMALGDAVGGGSARSWRRRASEQGKPARARVTRRESD